LGSFLPKPTSAGSTGRSGPALTPLAGGVSVGRAKTDTIPLSAKSEKHHRRVPHGSVSMDESGQIPPLRMNHVRAAPPALDGEDATPLTNPHQRIRKELLRDHIRESLKCVLTKGDDLRLTGRFCRSLRSGDARPRKPKRTVKTPVGGWQGGSAKPSEAPPVAAPVASEAPVVDAPTPRLDSGPPMEDVDVTAARFAHASATRAMLGVTPAEAAHPGVATSHSPEQARRDKEVASLIRSLRQGSELLERRLELGVISKSPPKKKRLAKSAEADPRRRPGFAPTKTR
jgi:hypothetical protein